MDYIHYSIQTNKTLNVPTLPYQIVYRLRNSEENVNDVVCKNLLSRWIFSLYFHRKTFDHQKIFYWSFLIVQTYHTIRFICITIQIKKCLQIFNNTEKSQEKDDVKHMFFSIYKSFINNCIGPLPEVGVTLMLCSTHQYASVLV